MSDWDTFRSMFPSGFGKKTKADDSASLHEKNKIAGNAPAKKQTLGPARNEQVFKDDDSDEEQINVGPPRPAMVDSDDEKPSTSSGVRATSAVEDEEDDGEMVGPPRPVVDSDEDDSDSDDDDDGFDLPVSYSVAMGNHPKGVTAIAIDPSGARFLSGSYDYSVKMYDFAGMDSHFRPFRTLEEPCGSFQIRDVSYSITGDQFLVCPASNRLKIFDRDGHELMQFQKGDMYLVDQTNTKGHVGAMTGASYHPNMKNIVMTYSEDSTLRLWDINKPDKNKMVVKHKNVRGMKVGVLCAAYSPDAKLIGVGCLDGSVQVWNAATSSFARPQFTMREAHAQGPDNAVSSVNIARDGYTLISRGGDHTMKIWDLRKFSTPLHVWEDLENGYQQTDCIFSPSEDVIVTGTSVSKKNGKGKLMFFDRMKFNTVKEVEVDGSAIRTVWHPRINQILVGSSDGHVHCLYDTQMSVRGAMLCAGRKAKRVDTAVADDLVGTIVTPHALPAFKDAPSRKRKQEKDALDPKKNHKPAMPPQGGVGRGGMIGSSLAQYMVKDMVKAPSMEDDPREAILKYAEEADSNPQFTTAYRKTQPVRILQTEDGQIIYK